MAIVMTVAGTIVFLLTENITLPMVLVDDWTIVNVIILVVEIIGLASTFKSKKEEAKTLGAVAVRAPAL